MKQAEFPDSVIEVKFGTWCLNIKRQIINDGIVEKELEPLLFKILSYLILNKNTIITRQNLIDDVWCQSYVDDNAINRAISELRKILKSPNQAALVVKTHYRKGYSFVPNVEFIESGYQSPNSNPVNELDSKEAAKPVAKKYTVWVLALLIILLASIVVSLFKWTATKNEVKIIDKSYQEEVLSMKDGSHSYLVLSPNEKNIAFIVSKGGVGNQLINKELDTGKEKSLSKPGYKLYPVGWSHNNNEIIYWQSNGLDCQVFIVDSNFSGESRYLFDCSHLPFSGQGVNDTSLVYSKFGYRNRDELAVLMNRNLITGEEYQISSPNLNSYGDQFLAYIKGKNKVVFERHQLDSSELYIADVEGGSQTHLYNTKNRIWTLKYHQGSDSLLWYDNVDRILYQYSLGNQKLLQKISMRGISDYSSTMPLNPSEMLAIEYPFSVRIHQLDLDNFNFKDMMPKDIYPFNAQNTDNGYIYYLFQDAQIVKLAVLDTTTGTVSIKSNSVDFREIRVSSDGEELLTIKANEIEVRDTAELNLKDTITIDGNIINVEYLNNRNIGYIVRGNNTTSNKSYLYDRETKKSILLPISNPIWFEQLSSSKYIFLSAQNKLQIFDSWNNLITHEFEISPVLYMHSFTLDGDKLFHSDGLNIYLYDFSLGFEVKAELVYTLKDNKLISQLSYANGQDSLSITTIETNNNKLIKVVEVPQ
ncbi:winged helix-turn-helix domain-containing protein [Pseudoalteromonas haloplanktis]|uniref:Winged helix-turn-helix domain-containing protein n=2 Tax=Pseudoalteromonas TaxID=53246 RepID=A0ABU1BKA1_PSEHA|nr:winged helix-turn-helix domain-containing protein [Pseudoalteromonas haloplanktis]MDQ9093944.1 winged helix-turn-helix domain-containing protein [Pseudoalteromonas haloplanktis]